MHGAGWGGWGGVGVWGGRGAGGVCAWVNIYRETNWCGFCCPGAPTAVLAQEPRHIILWEGFGFREAGGAGLSFL